MTPCRRRVTRHSDHHHLGARRCPARHQCYHLAFKWHPGWGKGPHTRANGSGGGGVRERGWGGVLLASHTHQWECNCNGCGETGPWKNPCEGSDPTGSPFNTGEWAWMLPVRPPRAGMVCIGRRQRYSTSLNIISLPYIFHFSVTPENEPFFHRQTASPRIHTRDATCILHGIEKRISSLKQFEYCFNVHHCHHRAVI